MSRRFLFCDFQNRGFISWPILDVNAKQIGGSASRLPFGNGNVYAHSLGVHLTAV
jgi:hypothetical protein